MRLWLLFTALVGQHKKLSSCILAIICLFICNATFLCGSSLRQYVLHGKGDLDSCSVRILLAAAKSVVMQISA